MRIDLIHGSAEYRAILKSWVKVCREYQTKVRGDRVGYHGERAQIGLLAAAVWKSSGVALEEWCTKKKSQHGDSRNGRGDLWLQRKEFKLHIEAKHAWITLQKGPDKSIGRVRGKLAEAQRDACDISCGRDEQRVGVLFAVPVVRWIDAADAERRLQEWLVGLEKLDCLALAATFDLDRIKPERRRRNENLLPGIALLIGRATRTSQLVAYRAAA